MEYVTTDTPIGKLAIGIIGNTVISVTLCTDDEEYQPSLYTEFICEVIKELQEYFKGRRKEFTFNSNIQGTSFQKRVWKELQNIPYGRTATYSEIAARIGNPKAARAVGMACNKNPLLIIIPCHRVVGRNRKLTGFAIGIERKEFLLNLEKDTIRI